VINYARRKNSGCVFWARLTAVGVVLFPLSLHHMDYRGSFSQGLSISAHKASPAYAAFEDSRESYGPSLPVIPDQGRVLKAGQAFDLQAIIHMPKIRQVAMHGITIRALNVEAPKPFFVAGETVRRELPVLRVFPTATIRRPSFEGLSSTAPSAAPEGPPGSVAQVAAQLVRDQLAAISKPDQQRVMVSKTGTPIIVRRATPEDAMPVIDLPGPAQPVPTLPVASVMAFAPALATHNPDPGDMRPLWLSGQVEMTGGLAVVGPETLVTVKRVFNGQVFEQGRIWVTEGKFEIRVKQPLGFLVAELATRDGRLLGRGEMSLFELGSLPEKDDHINDLRIALQPSADGVAFHAVSGYSHDLHRMMVADARVEIQSYSDPQRANEEGLVTEPTLSRDSSFVARALAKNHWPTLVVGQAREPQDIRLFANSLVDALINLALNGTDRREAMRQSVVWGRITRDGRAVTGAQVEMAGDYKPIYFNDMYLPDPGLAATAGNGLFAFIHVRPGVQAVRTRIGNKLYPAQVFPTEEKHVSYMELNVRDNAISQFKVFDGLNMNKPVAASIRLVGGDQTLAVAKDDFVSYSVAANPFMVEADGGTDYELSRVSVTGTPHVIHVPLVGRDWLYQIAQQKGFAPSAQRGTIVGYMDDHDFEVEVTGYAPGENMEIVYFDAQGNALDARTGVAGGGFVLFNAPIGLQTVYVHPTQSRETFAQVVIAEPGYVQVLTH
jgi:hypothetical protein